MADFPFDLPAGLADRLARHLDIEGKIPRALEALGPVAGRDVALVDAAGGLRAGQLTELGGRVMALAPAGALEALAGLPNEGVDVVAACWSAFRGVDPAEVAAADRVLRPGGRLLVLHDYGRDDVSRLRPADLPEYGSWGRRDGPFLRGGFRIRVIHCWWTFESLEAAQGFLGDAFGEAGAGLGATLKRPRISHNVAIYHRTRGGDAETA